MPVRNKERGPGRSPNRETPPVSPSLRVFGVPLALTAALVALTWLPRIQSSAALVRSFWIAAGLLLAWMAVLAALSRRTGPPILDVPPPKRQHYIQALCQAAVFAYWGWYWPPVYDFAPLIAAQLAFA